MKTNIAQYWNLFKLDTGRNEKEPYDIFKIGNSVESANNGLRLILENKKIATSSLPEDFGDKRPPRSGDLSIVLDGSDEPGCVVETTDVNLVAFNEVGETFAKDYGEWDGTLATWRQFNGEYYKNHARQFGIDWNENCKLICEYFRVLHRAEATQN